MSVVYKGQLIKMQWALWKELSCLSSLHIPYLIIGDFNAICSDSEHKGCSFTYYACKSVFFSMILSPKTLLWILNLWVLTLPGVMTVLALHVGLPVWIDA